jgi:hypothetical protein
MDISIVITDRQVKGNNWPVYKQFAVTGSAGRVCPARKPRLNLKALHPPYVHSCNRAASPHPSLIILVYLPKPRSARANQMKLAISGKRGGVVNAAGTLIGDNTATLRS